MSLRLVLAAVAVSLLSLNCIAKSSNSEKVSAPGPVVLSDSALDGEAMTPISCGAAFRIAEHHGYQNVTVQNCFGTEYAFRASRNGLDVIVLVDPANGRLWQGKVLR
ncbi:MAG: hypothetical protein AB7F76_03305 [Parvibaculaceae bacterium]|jgi:hypothetical protein